MTGNQSFKVVSFLGLLATLTISAGRPVGAAIPSSYNHQFSGITITNDGTGTTNPDAFGFVTGSTVTFTGFSGTYDLVSVRAFSLLYNPTFIPGYTVNDTAAIGDTSFGAKQVWTATTDTGNSYGWEDSFNSKGSAKAGNFGPNDTTGNVFTFNRALTQQELTSYYGFDLAVQIVSGNDPFGNNTQAGQISTGRAYELSNSVTPTPEPGSVLTLGAGGFGLLGLMVRARRRQVRQS